MVDPTQASQIQGEEFDLEQDDDGMQETPDGGLLITIGNEVSDNPEFL